MSLKFTVNYLGSAGNGANRSKILAQIVADKIRNRISPCILPNPIIKSSYPNLFSSITLFSFLAIIFFIICFVSCTPVSQQKKQQGMSEDLLSVTFPTEKEGWACGRWGTVLHTADGGKTWRLQPSGTENTLVSIHFVDSQNGWAVGEEGAILHTADGGNTWEQQKSPVPFYLMKVYFVTPLKGWIVGERTHILSTVDGGKTWNIQFKDEDFILKSVSFCDELHGWAVGEYGYIYHTKNGGAT
jgi:hypothetical protein